MRKVFLNKWFLPAALLIISLSAFSFIAYKKTSSVCTVTRECSPKPEKEPVQRGEMMWDAVSRQFTTVISVQ